LTTCSGHRSGYMDEAGSMCNRKTGFEDMLDNNVNITIVSGSPIGTIVIH